VHPAGATPDRPPGPGTSIGAHLYLELLKRSLTRTNASLEPLVEIEPHRLLPRAAFRLVEPVLRRRGIRFARRTSLRREALELGVTWHPEAETMIGLARLSNIQDLVVNVVRGEVPGDLVETGVWRGGATIFMRGVLKALAVEDRVVWAADSFQGLPVPDPERYPADAGQWLWRDGGWSTDLSVSLEEVRANFDRYGLLDDQVRFLQGWFEDTLPAAPIERIAVLRLDGDLYASTIQALDALYPRVSPGGYVIVDDYGAWESCRKAVDDFRRDHAIGDELAWVDWTAVYWRKPASPPT
jgi:O-methyltransferase